MEKIKIDTKPPRTRDWKQGCATLFLVALLIISILSIVYHAGENVGFADGYCWALGYHKGRYANAFYTVFSYDPKDVICIRYAKPGGNHE